MLTPETAKHLSIELIKKMDAEELYTVIWNLSQKNSHIIFILIMFIPMMFIGAVSFLVLYSEFLALVLVINWISEAVSNKELIDNSGWDSFETIFGKKFRVIYVISGIVAYLLFICIYLADKGII